MTIEEMIAALERAKGPSRELDGHIAFAVGYELRGGIWRDPDNIPLEKRPAFTSSIDAALTLLGPADWTLERDEGGYQSTVWTGYEWVRGHSVDSPAIALAIAALKARKP